MKFYTVAQVADRLGVSEGRLRSNLWRVERIKLGRLTRLAEPAIAQLAELFAVRRDVKLRAYAPAERAACEAQAQAMLRGLRCRARSWTYVATADRDDAPFKIGSTNKPGLRLWFLDRMSPFAIRLVAVAAGADYEPVLHARYREHRVRGEWFARQIGLDLAARFAARPAGACLRCVLEGHRCRL